jgi:hypothetical protein
MRSLANNPRTNARIAMILSGHALTATSKTAAANAMAVSTTLARRMVAVGALLIVFLLGTQGCRVVDADGQHDDRSR